MHSYLIFGAQSGIAQGVIQLLLTNSSVDITVHAFSRGAQPSQLNELEHGASKLVWHQLEDYDVDTLNKNLAELELPSLDLAGVYVFNGILHNDDFMPEKALSQFNQSQFEAVMHANTTVPVTIIQQVLATINSKQSFKIAALSARIGSIGDNGLGGWHSYRASKAALNMLLQNIAIEASRRFKGIKVISYHPGTTDTPLSVPFQSNVPDGKLFDKQQSAQYFLDVVAAQSFDQTLSYVDWQGNSIPW